MGRLIEKDYFCTLLLDLFVRGSRHGVGFQRRDLPDQGPSELYRLSEDLDYTIPFPVDAPRKERSNRAER